MTKQDKYSIWDHILNKWEKKYNKAFKTYSEEKFYFPFECPKGCPNMKTHHE